MILAGVDLAWSGKNPSAIAIGRLQDARLEVLSIVAIAGGANAVVERLATITALGGVAIDAPLIISNASGQRPCETALGKVYGSRGCACHTTNTRLLPNAPSVRLASKLETQEFEHLRGEKWQIECYPHPAIVNLFGLIRVLKYKKGNVAERRAGQRFLAAQIRALSKCERLDFRIENECTRVLDDQLIDSLRGRALKMNEDHLDSLICLYTAGLYAIGHSGELFGDTASGYI